MIEERRHWKKLGVLSSVAGVASTVENSPNQHFLDKIMDFDENSAHGDGDGIEGAPLTKQMQIHIWIKRRVRQNKCWRTVRKKIPPLKKRRALFESC